MGDPDFLSKNQKEVEKLLPFLLGKEFFSGRLTLRITPTKSEVGLSL